MKCPAREKKLRMKAAKKAGLERGGGRREKTEGQGRQVEEQVGERESVGRESSKFANKVQSGAHTNTHAPPEVVVLRS